MSDQSDQQRRYEELRSDYHSAAEHPLSDAPPRQQFSDQRHPQAEWTTGQGIGFLVALPGWSMAGLALLVGAVGLAAGSEGFGAPEFLVVVVTAVFGVVIAVPGTIVFNKCKRR